MSAGNARLVEALLTNTEWLDDDVVQSFKKNDEHIGNLIYHVPANTLNGMNVYTYAAKLIPRTSVFAYECETLAQAQSGAGLNLKLPPLNITDEQKRFPSDGKDFGKPNYFHVCQQQ